MARHESCVTAELMTLKRTETQPEGSKTIQVCVVDNCLIDYVINGVHCDDS